jgi:peptide/nickel transport system permease protein
MRLTDLQLDSPFILLALAIVPLLGPSRTNIIVVSTVTSWPIHARVVRGSVLALNTVIAFFEIPRMIITVAALGFLGLGVQPPTATWGNMLADGRDYIRDAWCLSAFRVWRSC